MRAVIFANGSITDLTQAQAVLRAGDVLIAADGGARHLQTLELSPDILIGDFDSLSAEELDALHASGSQLIQHPSRKDSTDLELAIQHALSLGAGEVLVLGALGHRWDQTLANLLLAAWEGFSTAQISLLDGAQELRLLRPGQSLQINGKPGDTVSLIPLCGDAHGILTRNLEYPLNDETLHFGSTRGISNVLLADTASVSLHEGMLMVVVIHLNK